MRWNGALVLALALALALAMTAHAGEGPRRNGAGDGAAGRIDPAALEALVKKCEATGSHALVILQDGKTVGEWYFGHPVGRIESMSATKPIVALAVGMLIDAGRIKGLDQPVADFFPEWRQGRKRSITIRHLLEHRSGLQAERTTGGEIYPAPDFVQLALAAELSDDPGAKFFYNNKAVNLLAGVVQRASGKRMDQYLADALFTPLGITDFQWQLDHAGNPHGMSGLRIRPLDLARIGQLLVDGGKHGGKQLIGRAWIEEMTRPGRNPQYGLLWWIHSEASIIIDDSVVAAWRKAGTSEEFIARTKPLRDHVYPSADAFFADAAKVFNGPQGLEEWYAATWKRDLPDGKVVDRRVLGYSANGSAGQFLVVYPHEHLVAVRMRRVGDDPAEQEDRARAFGDFPGAVRQLVARRQATKKP